MPSLDTAVIVLAGIALFAAFVNGAIGYGFSSLTVPLALLFYTNRILNPAVVVIEVFLNLYVLFINRDGVPAVWKRVLPILIGLLPGIAVGAFVLALLQPGWIKLGTYTVILPLILVQAAGWRRPIRSTWLIGLPFGTALGILYSVTTISGPPLAILFNNQGLVKNEFRAGLALVRVAESSVTAIVYYQLGLFIAESEHILLVFIPCVVVGVPLGAYVIRRLDAETFRRICMSFDAWVVGFGLSRVLIELNLIESPWAYSVMVVTILIDIYLLYIFFARKAASKRSQTPWAPLTPGDRSGPHDRIPSDMTELPFDPLGPLGLLLGYIITILAVGMLLYTVSPAIRLSP
jgi:uncharacterized membrane protein YfcA